MNFNLPDIGEGIKDVTVTDILVKDNQELSKNDNVIIVESEKTSIEIPIDLSGKIKKIHINIGSKISPGDLILSLYSDVKVNIDKEEVVDSSEKNIQKNDTKIIKDTKENNKGDVSVVYASPSVRKLARELNCNLNETKGTGNNGRITFEDVKNNKNNLSDLSLNYKANDKVDDIYNSCSKWGLCEKIRLNNIKIITAKRLHESWSSIPHVTQFDECDMTELDRIRTIIKNNDKSSKVSFVSFFIKAAAIVLRDIPIFNTSLSDSKYYMIQKNYYNVGVAVDTDRGLVVPVIKNVDKKSIKQINKELLILINKAKNKRLTIDDMSGGCFTITSLGGIGGKFFTPIINPPEVAILGISKMDIKPVFMKNKFRARKILPISLSYDHRIIDGAAAAAFTNLFSNLISTPKLLNG
jgi:pyruvate dehydrogenase E2 component (dihydrolipoamide acetyltransferase)